MSVRRATVIAAVVLLAALAAVSWHAGWFGHGSPTTRASRSPVRVGEIPSTLPSAGVKVGDVVLRPLRSTPRGALSARQAIAKALNFTDKSRHLPVTALEADITLPGSSLTLRGPASRLGTPYKLGDRIPVWVVTLTYPQPEDVGVAAPSYATHQSVAVDAVTGKFVVGFFE